MNRKQMLAALLTGAMLSPTCVQAQVGVATSTTPSTAPTPAADDGEGLGDIVVTARKRRERLQDVPVAVSAASGAALLGQGATTVQDIARVAPGLFYQSIEPSRPNIYLRGIGTRSFDAGAESSIGTFVDGVYIGRFGAQLQDLVGVDRIEVLKGPQGALFGRNTIGGAINVVTQKPRDEVEGRVSATYGRQSHFDADNYSGSAIVSAPIVAGKLFGLVSASRNHSDGYMLATNTGKRFNGVTSNTARGRLVWQAADNFELDLISDYFSSKNALGFRASDVGGTRPAILVARPGLTAPVDPDPYRFTQTPGIADTKRHGGGVSLTSTYAGDAVGATSITAYRAGRTSGSSDLDGTILDTVQNPVRERSSQFSQEFRLSSTDGGALTFGDKVDWIAGVYYFSEDVRRVEGRRLGVDSVLTFFSNGVPFTEESDVDINTRSYALFGQIGLAITDTLKLDAGLRYSNDRKKAVIGARTPVPLPFLTPANFEITPIKTFSSVDPSLTLSYKPNPDVLAYASYSKGFKSGAFQYFAFTAPLAAIVVDPEKLDAYQGGIKADLFDRRLRLNASAFLYKYKDIQVPRIEIPAGGTVPSVTLSNAARSTVKGFEIEGAGIISPALRIEYGYAYLDAKFDRYIYSPTLDFSGNRLPRAPKHTLDLAAVVTVATGLGKVELRGAGSYLSSLYFEPDNARVDPGTREPGRTLYDVSASLTRGAYSLTIFGRNLTDKGYRSSVLNISGSRLDEVYAPRRVVGITFSAALQ